MSTTAKPTTRKARGQQTTKRTPASKPTAKPTPTPAVKQAKPAPSNCACGCGAPTITAKAAFLSGHDARFAGRVGRGEITLNEHQQAVLKASPRLQAKVDGIIRTTAKRAAEKAAREAAAKAAKEAYAAVLAS